MVGEIFLKRFHLSNSLPNFYDDMCVCNFKATIEFNQTSYFHLSDSYLLPFYISTSLFLTNNIDCYNL